MPGPRGGRDLFARIVEAIKELGASSFTQIARRAGTSVPTVHYYLTKKFPSVGVLVRVVPNLRRLGLKEYLVEMDFSENSHTAIPTLDFLGSYSYLAYYTKRIPRGDFLTLWNVPQMRANAFLAFLDNLQESGLLSSYRVHPLAWRKTLSLRPEFFDVRNGKWCIDWGEVARRPVHVEFPPDSEPVVDFDAIDLLILKELQKSAFASKTVIARAIGVSDKTVQFHWLHVEANKLVESWSVNVFDVDIRKYSCLFLICEGGNPEHAIKVIAKLPFIWRVWLSDDRNAVIAWLFVPNEELTKTFAFLAESLSGYGEVKPWFIDPSFSYAYVIPFKMYVDGRWIFDGALTLSYLLDYLKNRGRGRA